MSFKLTIILLNVIAIGGTLAVVAWRVFSMERNPEPEPANLTPFLEDDQLEGRRLERVLGAALVFSVIMLVALLAYFIWEPFRTEAGLDQFKERSIERGATLFANEASEVYDSETSLQCANCHGEDATGGVAVTSLQSEADECQKEENQANRDVPECLAQQIQWSAPDLTRAAVIYTRAQLVDIVTYGRPGTPMQPWGVKSGKGPKNTQSINDIVNYIESLALTPDEAVQQSTDAIAEYRSAADDAVTDLQTQVDEAGAALDALQADADALETASEALADLQEQLTLAIAYRDDVAGLSDGAVLFRLNCARCHTKGWSWYENDPYNPDLPTLPPQGSGAYGPNLTGGAVLLQFPGEAGLEKQMTWVTDGVPENDPYGVRGISSGRMPHFANALTKKQIRAIVDYERQLSGEAEGDSGGSTRVSDNQSDEGENA